MPLPYSDAGAKPAPELPSQAGIQMLLAVPLVASEQMRQVEQNKRFFHRFAQYGLKHFRVEATGEHCIAARADRLTRLFRRVRKSTLWLTKAVHRFLSQVLKAQYLIRKALRRRQQLTEVVVQWWRDAEKQQQAVFKQKMTDCLAQMPKDRRAQPLLLKAHKSTLGRLTDDYLDFWIPDALKRRVVREFQAQLRRQHVAKWGQWRARSSALALDMPLNRQKAQALQALLRNRPFDISAEKWERSLERMDHQYTQMMMQKLALVHEPAFSFTPNDVSLYFLVERAWECESTAAPSAAAASTRLDCMMTEMNTVLASGGLVGAEVDEVVQSVRPTTGLHVAGGDSTLTESSPATAPAPDASTEWTLSQSNQWLSATGPRAASPAEASPKTARPHSAQATLCTLKRRRKASHVQPPLHVPAAQPAALRVPRLLFPSRRGSGVCLNASLPAHSPCETRSPCPADGAVSPCSPGRSAPPSPAKGPTAPTAPLIKQHNMSMYSYLQSYGGPGAAEPRDDQEGASLAKPPPSTSASSPAPAPDRPAPTPSTPAPLTLAKGRRKRNTAPQQPGGPPGDASLSAHNESAVLETGEAASDPPGRPHSTGLPAATCISYRYFTARQPPKIESLKEKVARRMHEDNRKHGTVKTRRLVGRATGAAATCTAAVSAKTKAPNRSGGPSHQRPVRRRMQQHHSPSSPDWKQSSEARADSLLLGWS